MNKSQLFASVFATIAFASASTHAATIVDTGPGPNTLTGTNWSLYPEETSGPFGQFLAAEFSIGNSVAVTEIEGWMARTQAGANGTIAIYSDGGDIPGTELYATTFFGTGSSSNSWIGASGLSWYLDSGAYWLAFEVRSGQTLNTSMPSPSSSPLLNEAYTNFNTGDWSGYDALDLGIRITAVPVAVPLPAAAWLLAYGLLGLVGIARHKKSA